MTDTTVNIDAGSPEYVAYKLLLHIAEAEGKVFHGNPGEGQMTVHRGWILQTYGQCLSAVKSAKAPTRR